LAVGECFGEKRGERKFAPGGGGFTGTAVFKESGTLFQGTLTSWRRTDEVGHRLELGPIQERRRERDEIPFGGNLPGKTGPEVGGVYGLLWGNSGIPNK